MDFAQPFVMPFAPGLGVAVGGAPLLSSYLNTLILAESAGGVYWPFDDTGAFARAVNPALSLGRNLVINGDFASDTVWTKGTGWTIAAGVAHNDGTGAATNLSQTITGLVIGKSYEVTFTVLNFVSGSVRPLVGGSGTGTSRTANGTYTETIVCAGSTAFLLQTGASFVGDIDNVSVKQVNILASSAYPSAELVTNGSFAVDASWTKGSGWTISGGNAVASAAVGSLSQAMSISLGKTYLVVFTISGYSAGSVQARVGSSGTGTSRSANGTYTEKIICAGNTTFELNPSTFTGNIDNVSIVEINPLTAQVSGATVNVDSGNPRIGKVYSFDGVNDVVNPYSGDINSVFNPNAGTAIVFMKAASAALWSDATARVVIRFQWINNTDLVDIVKTAAANTLQFRYVASSTTSTIITTAIGGSVAWNMLAMTWDKGADQYKVNINGVQIGATQTGLGVMVGNLQSTLCGIGAAGSAAGNPFVGFIAHPYLVNRAMTAAELLTIAQRAGVA